MLGNNIRLYRQARGESLSQLARAVGVDPTNLSKIERGLRGCSAELALRFARHFDVPVGALFFADEVVSKTA